MHGDIQNRELHRINTVLDEEYSRSRIKPNDIIISLVGTIGKVATIPFWLTCANIHRNLARVRVSKALPRFVFYYLQSSTAKKLIEDKTFGSNQPLLNLGDLRNLLTPVPTLEEQRLISNLLDAHFLSIKRQEKYLVQLNILKSSLMQDLLTGRVRVGCTS
jgi:type I restriction enzyme S subunit